MLDSESISDRKIVGGASLHDFCALRAASFLNEKDFHFSTRISRMISSRKSLKYLREKKKTKKIAFCMVRFNRARFVRHSSFLMFEFRRSNAVHDLVD